MRAHSHEHICVCTRRHIKAYIQKLCTLSHNKLSMISNLITTLDNVSTLSDKTFTLVHTIAKLRAHRYEPRQMTCKHAHTRTRTHRQYEVTKSDASTHRHSRLIICCEKMSTFHSFVSITNASYVFSYITKHISRTANEKLIYKINTNKFKDHT